MRFTVLGLDQSIAIFDEPGLYLRRHKWDDFGFKTQFFLHHKGSDGSITNLGYVKVAHRGMPHGYVTLPPTFDELPSYYFSLGQHEDYYSLIRRMGRSVEVFEALRDLAYDDNLFRQVWQRELVVRDSLLRSVSPNEVLGPLHRAATGSVRRSPFEFVYQPPAIELATWKDQEATRLDFVMNPRSRPPSNVHVLIGRNGVGKTHLLRSMISSAALASPNRFHDGHFEMRGNSSVPFTGIISVSFSAFDRRLHVPSRPLRDDIRYASVSLRDEDDSLMDEAALSRAFSSSAIECTNPAKVDLWKRALRILESDPVFQSYGFSSLADWWLEAEEEEVDQVDAESEFQDDAGNIFARLSSGHKVVLLAITKLVELLEERTLVVMDEPEAHLHPPLLSAFIRAVSTLLTLENGVAIVATHSPVVLQEVPGECVWELRRVGGRHSADRLKIETFAENVDTLTREVFGLELTQSGYHALLQGAVDEGASYEEIVDELFDGQIGSEGRAVLRSMISTRSRIEGR